MRVHCCPGSSGPDACSAPALSIGMGLLAELCCVLVAQVVYITPLSVWITRHSAFRAEDGPFLTVLLSRRPYQCKNRLDLQIDAWTISFRVNIDRTLDHGPTLNSYLLPPHPRWRQPGSYRPPCHDGCTPIQLSWGGCPLSPPHPTTRW